MVCFTAETNVYNQSPISVTKIVITGGIVYIFACFMSMTFLMFTKVVLIKKIFTICTTHFFISTFFRFSTSFSFFPGNIKEVQFKNINTM